MNTASGVNQNASTANSGTSTDITTQTLGGGNATTTNSGTVNGAFGILTQTLNGGNAVTINSGTVSAGGGVTTLTINGGDARTTNSGTISGGGVITTVTVNGGNATATNSGTISGGGFFLTSAIGDGNATATNSGAISDGGFMSAAASSGNATATNSGTISGGGGVIANVLGAGNAVATNSGMMTGQFSFIQTLAPGGGNAVTTNSGTFSGSDSFIVTVAAGGGNATMTNSGTVGGPNNLILTTAAGGGNATMTNLGIVSRGSVVTGTFGGGTATLINSGTISNFGDVAIRFIGDGADVLTLLPGSFIVGAINLVGVNDTVNVNARNLNLTFNTLAGATVTGTVPFVVSGNRIASIDPTGFAVADRNLMEFTRAVSGMLGGRASEAAASGGGGGALGFAGADGGPRIDDAFAQVMGYAKAADNAIVFKNPSMMLSDGSVVWAKGFYGQRTQQADGPVLRNVTNFYGGAIGMDGLARPDLRLGGFIGGGAINSSFDFNFGNANSEIVFGGGYGRKDFGAAFVEFALLGGHTDNRTTRNNINNNLLAGGLEIATAGFGGWFVSPEIAAGRRYDFAPGWSVTPVARLRYLAASFDGFTETGSTAGLTAGSRNLQNIEERGDVTLTRTVLSPAGRVQLGVTAGVLGQQRSGGGAVNAILLGQALAFATPGKSSIGGVYAGGSIDWRTKSGVSLFGAAEYAAMSDSSNTVTGKAGLRVGF